MPHRVHFRLLLASGVALAAVLTRFWTAGAAEPAVAEPEAADPKSTAEAAPADDSAQHWVRVLRDDKDRPVAMQTSIVRYQVPAAEGRDKLSVDLIGAVHVGDRAYYKTLNDEFKQYDALLFELVAPPNTKIRQGRGTSSAHPVGALQNGLKDLLQLEHQLELVNYEAENFVHADMSPDQFAKSMSDRNESFLQMLFRMMGQGIAQQSKQQAQGKSSDLDLFQALFAKDRPLQLKRIMAEQFENMESMLVSMGGPDGSAIITERNKVALEVLSRELAAGRKKVGIFYGTGHLKDMDARLREQFKLVPVETRWITAWDLKGR